ncbi:MAG: hypothetical protein FD168_1499 [Desulfobulbaceae bacterium]|nr:MAG: hypothetical protein FD168_1499 [Desulfobulbaceae bacterium]
MSITFRGVSAELPGGFLVVKGNRNPLTKGNGA